VDGAADDKSFGAPANRHGEHRSPPRARVAPGAPRAPRAPGIRSESRWS